MSVLAIIQARFNSSRLPGKVLLDLEGRTVLERVVERVARARRVDEVVVATSTAEHDGRIAELCLKKDIKVFRGSLDDVLDRFYQCARSRQADAIVRITADCPLIDPAVINQVVGAHLAGGADYTCNTMPETFPDGQDVEVFSFAALERAWKEAALGSEREHVTSYLRKNPGLFKLRNVACGRDLSTQRWTLDNEEDYALIKAVYAALHPKDPFFGMEGVENFLRGRPELERLNSHIERNEGYAASLKKDREKT